MNQFEIVNTMALKAFGMPQAPKPAHYKPPTICRRCDDVIDVKAHTLDECEEIQQQAAIAADLALNRNKVERRLNDAYVRDMQRQIDNATGEFS